MIEAVMNHSKQLVHGDTVGQHKIGQTDFVISMEFSIELLTGTYNSQTARWVFLNNALITANLMLLILGIELKLREQFTVVNYRANYFCVQLFHKIHTLDNVWKQIIKKEISDHLGGNDSSCGGWAWVDGLYSALYLPVVKVFSFAVKNWENNWLTLVSMEPAQLNHSFFSCTFIIHPKWCNCLSIVLIVLQILKLNSQRFHNYLPAGVQRLCCL